MLIIVAIFAGFLIGPRGRLSAPPDRSVVWLQYIAAEIAVRFGSVDSAHRYMLTHSSAPRRTRSVTTHRGSPSNLNSDDVGSEGSDARESRIDMCMVTSCLIVHRGRG